MLRRRIAGAVLAAILTSLAACGTDTSSTAPGTNSAAPPQTTSTGTSTTSTQASPSVPDQLKFTVQTVDGQSFSGESLAGKKAVLWFWAPWCPKCRAEAPRVAAAAQATSGKVTFVGVAAQDALPAMKKFVTDYKVSGFTHLADLDAAIWTRFGVTQQPAYAFISPDGKVDVVKQQLSESALTERVNALTAA
ncbi:thiol:disulfide interchange protein [Kibdelosporangium aridum]|uniref:Thiol:disulfide interchange protein n=2 Tax=Pseudonocardiaceae TaxID=2070 RepID=A0A428ZIY4_KIBAR|nr:redoxin family protein [Kibdelosporangium aridum]RSM88027.1 thiol:disulfide interchange protein [Kibdelosporangium aridum]CAB45042.1 putative [Amycolatopsis orientalis]